MMKMKSTAFFFNQLSLLFFTVAVSDSLGLGNETDRVALLAFKDQIAQNPIMSSWNSSLHFCDWEGVICATRHQRVMALELGSQALRGSISPYVGNLSFLRSLSLENNSLYGEIPPQLGRLFRLEELRLDNNSLSGTLPVNLSQCLELGILRVPYNNLTGKIPEEIGLLWNLWTLRLSYNHFTGNIPTRIGNLSYLESLFLTGNELTGSIPDFFGQLKHMYGLSLGANMLSGILPPSLYNHSSLERLYLTSNELQGNLPSNNGLMLPKLSELGIGANRFSGIIPISLFTNASAMELLDLGSNNFTGQVPVQIGSLKRLRILNLEKNQLGSGGEVDDLSFLNSLSNCSHLSIMSISFNNFGGILPSTVANLSTNITQLHLAYNQISGSIPTDIWKLSNLITFPVSYNILTGPIPTSIGRLHKLQLMNLAYNRITGTIPYSIGNLSSLYLLQLAGNMLEGNIATSIDKCVNLQQLNLESNNLSGYIPKQLFGASSQLSQINLSGNIFFGSLPSEVGSLKTLQLLDLSHNKLSGEIPISLGSCLSLEALYLQGNSFQGHIPSSFGYLKGIQVIDLSRNNLSGNISHVLEGLSFLQILNLSFNSLVGLVPTKGVLSNATAFSVLGNANLCGGITQLHLPACPVHKSRKKQIPLALIVTLGVLLLFFVISSLLLLLCLRKRHRAKPKPASITLENSLPRVSYNALYNGTNGFSLDNLVGKGSYGYVYKGVLPEVKSVIAVKVLNLVESGAIKSFIAECDVLGSIRHRNLLKILTVCSSVDFKGNDFKALVYEFMSNGSLEQWLHPRLDASRRPSRYLNALERLNIAIDVAYALDYLHNHSERPIIHCDLKPSNVLLDDDMVGYVGDFGLAKFLVKNTSNVDGGNTNSIAIRGTVGYIPPEYGMGVEVSTRGDVYSYGIMLLELFTGKRPTDASFNDNQNLRDYCKRNSSGGVIDYLDISLRSEVQNESTIGDIKEHIGLTESMKECLDSIISIAIACSSESTMERMDIKDVIKSLLKVKKTVVEVENHEKD